MRHRPIALGIALAIALAGLAHAQGEHAHAAGDDVIEVVSANVGGKNVFIPSTLVVASGRPHTLSIFNTTDIPHGFAIPELGIETVLPVGEEHRVELPTIQGSRIYRIRCHLHPAHRNATLAVIETD